MVSVRLNISLILVIRPVCVYLIPPSTQATDFSIHNSTYIGTTTVFFLAHDGWWLATFIVYQKGASGLCRSFKTCPPPHLLVVVVCRVIESLYVCMNMYMYMYKLIRYVRS